MPPRFCALHETDCREKISLAIGVYVLYNIIITICDSQNIHIHSLPHKTPCGSEYFAQKSSLLRCSEG
jgi:hypothetical protein